MKALYWVRQIRALESLAIKKYSIPESTLMERAGNSIWHILQEKWPDAKRLVVFCGPGNNGGDGYVLARLALSQMEAVDVYYLGDLNALKPAARAAYEGCVERGINVLPWQDYQPSSADVMVDALLGIGFEGALEGAFAEVASLMNASAVKEGVNILAVDIPSGLLADTGCVFGEAVKADCTVTFIGMKPGLLIAEGSDYAGEVICDDLQLPEEAYADVLPVAKTLDLDFLKKQNLPPRRRNTHKGDFGHVLVIGGAQGMPGSVRMAAEAALSVGAGLVTVATHPAHAAWISIQRPEIMSYGVETPDQLDLLIDRATVIVAGTGLGQGDWGCAMFEKIIKITKPLLLDADALNLLAKQPTARKSWVLTPHPGEAARLLKTDIQSIQKNRLEAVTQLQVQWGGVCVLKGAGTLIKGEAEEIQVCTAGNPGMASGGMGDILSGVIGGLMAQKLPVNRAAELGVCLHAKAGDAAALVKGERGLLAMDLMPYLQLLVG